MSTPPKVGQAKATSEEHWVIFNWTLVRSKQQETKSNMRWAVGLILKEIHWTTELLKICIGW